VTSRRLRYTPGQGVTVVLEGNRGANGLTRDLQGRLISAEAEPRSVTRVAADGTVTIIADQYQGKRLLPPNDVIVKSDGSIYFTCPPPQFEVGESDASIGVYRVLPDLSSIALVAEDLAVPNGLAFTPDEKVLYVNDSKPRHVRAYDVLASGLLAKNSGRVFADLSGGEPGTTDGLKVDRAGNVYSGGSGGLYILDPKGKKLGRIHHGLSFTTNVAFGGDDWKTLYFTTRSSLNMVNVKVPGVPVWGPQPA